MACLAEHHGMFFAGLRGLEGRGAPAALRGRFWKPAPVRWDPQSPSLANATAYALMPRIPPPRNVAKSKTWRHCYVYVIMFGKWHLEALWQQEGECNRREISGLGRRRS